MRTALGIGAFISAVLGAIGAYQCFSVYNDEKAHQAAGSAATTRCYRTAEPDTIGQERRRPLTGVQ